jgi:glycogen synthase
MHVLITADTIGGVWTYTQELVCGLVRSGHRVSLVSFGDLPDSGQVNWLKDLSSIDYYPTRFRLEWMEGSERDVGESKVYLEKLIRRLRPDILHFSQYCYGDLANDIPRIVVAHSDVVTWWLAVRGCEPQDCTWIRWYRDTVRRGLEGADTVVAPSQWMRNALIAVYGRHPDSVVIYNARDPSRFNRARDKENFVLSVGRLWDEAKQVQLLAKADIPYPICVVGPTETPRKSTTSFPEMTAGRIQFSGKRSQEQLRDICARASIYAATSCYEPFGLAPLEAAFSHCALVMNDIPVFRELWGDSAAYFKTNDARDLASVLVGLASDEPLRRNFAERAFECANSRFTTTRMVEQYQSIYENVCAARSVA